MMNPKQLEEVKRGLRNTWQMIGGEIAQGRAVPRDEVIEVVLDSSYLEYEGRIDKSLVKEFRKLSFDEQIKIAEECFPCRWYE